MIAEVVPVTRIRRNTAAWSYLVPKGSRLLPGALVVIPFRGRPCLGVVWSVEESDARATEKIERVVCQQPLVRAPQRAYVEHLSQAGLCSLSTALHGWLPRGLRSLPLSAAARGHLAAFDRWQPDPAELAAIRQHCVLVPGFRPEQSRQLRAKFGRRFAELIGPRKEAEELADWFAVARGDTRVALGREGALQAPWANLRQLTVLEPEDIAYYHEQAPYLNLVDAARELASLSRAAASARTYLPEPVAEALYRLQAQAPDLSRTALSFLDLNQETLLNETLVGRIKETLAAGKTVLLLHNAHDHLVPRTDNGRTEKVLLPGIETLAKKLAFALDLRELPDSLRIGTRAMLSEAHENVGFTAVLSLDPLLRTPVFADQVHGWADLGRLFAYEAPCLIQTRDLGHPLVQALRGSRFAEYLETCVQEQHELRLPPFGQHLACSLPASEGSELVAVAMFEKLAPLVTEPWQLGHPLQSTWRKKPFWHIVLSGPEQGRLPKTVRDFLIALPRPWRVQHNPWHII